MPTLSALQTFDDMNNKTKRDQRLSGRLLWLALIMCACFLAACGKQKPQLPSNKQPEVDSVALAMIEMNQRLVQKANDELASYVVTSGQPYVQDDQGFWYMITRRTEGLMLQKEQTVTITQQVYLLDGTLCEDMVMTLQIGKKQVPTAVESALLLLREGESASILAPWYLAYGQYGNEAKIGAYANVRFEISVMEL